MEGMCVCIHVCMYEAKMLVDTVTKSLHGKTSVESLILRAQCSVTLGVIAKWKVCVCVCIIWFCV